MRENWKIAWYKTKNYGSPTVTGDDPDMGEPGVLDQEQISQYQILIGRGKLAITLGWYNQGRTKTHSFWVMFVICIIKINAF